MSDAYGLYISGITPKPNEYPAKLDDTNNTFSSILTLLDSTATIYSMAVYNGTLYVSGVVANNDDGNTPYFAKLDNNTNRFVTNIIKIPNQFTSSGILSMTIYKKNLYMCMGDPAWDDDGPLKHIITYNDQNKTVSSDFNFDGLTVKSINVMTSYKGILCIGGNYTTGNTGNTINSLYVATLDDTNNKFRNFLLPDTGVPAADGYAEPEGIYSMTVYSGDLYVGGRIIETNQPNMSYLAKASNLNDSISRPDTFTSIKLTDLKGNTVNIGNINAMIQYKDNLYLLGDKGAGYYNGKINKNFDYILSDSGIIMNSFYMSNLTIYNSELYASTGYTPYQAPDPNNKGVYKLDNNKWTSFNKGIPSGTNILPMIDYNKNVNHADLSNMIFYKKNSLSSFNLALIFGLSVGGGILLLGIIIYLCVKDPLHVFSNSGGN